MQYKNGSFWLKLKNNTPLMSITIKTDFTYRSMEIYVFICLSIFFFLVYVVYSYLYVLQTMNAVEVEITTVKTGFEPKASTIAVLRRYSTD